MKVTIYENAIQTHQQFYEKYSHFNKFERSEHVELKNYIALILNGLSLKDDENVSTLYMNNKNKKIIDQIYRQIINTDGNKFSNQEITVTIIFNYTYNHKSLENTSSIELEKIIKVYPIFVVKKKILKTDKFQYFFIDTEARLYSSWKNYKTTNTLPTCTMLLPKNGYYQANLKELWSDDLSIVWLERYEHLNDNNIIRKIDLTTTCVNATSLAIGLSGLFVPLSAPIIASVGLATVASGIWGTSREVIKLYDRYVHNQTINVTNRQSFSSWVGIASNSFGIASSTSSRILSNAISSGRTVNRFAQVTYNTLKIADLITNSTGIIYNSINIIENYKKTGEVSKLDLLRLSANIFFSYNAVINLQLASDIIKSDQNRILQDYEKSLVFKKHKKEYHRLVKNTKSSNIGNEVKANEQIIRSLKNIQNKDEFFSLIAKNKNNFLNEDNKLFFTDGKVQSANKLMDIGEFVSTLKNPNEKINNLSTNKKISVVKPINVPYNNANDAKISSILKNNVTVSDFAEFQNINVTQLTSYLTNIWRICNTLPDNWNIQDIIEILLKGAIKLVVKCALIKTNDLLNNAVGFIWNYLRQNVCNNTNVIFNREYEQLIKSYLNDIFKKLENEINVWIEYFEEYVKSILNINCEPVINTNIFKDLINNCEIQLIIPETFVFSSELKHNILYLTNSQLCLTFQDYNDANIYIEEVREYCFLKRIPINFDLNELGQKLSGLFTDLNNFEYNYLIFYKLMVIGFNANDDRKIYDNMLNIIIKQVIFVWFLVNIQLQQMKLKIKKDLNCELQNTIIKIITVMYHDQINEPEKWSKSFKNFNIKF